MGLSSSQGRLLMLTSAISDVQLGEILISQKQNQLATQSEDAAQAYSEATSNYKMQIKVTDKDSLIGYKTEDLNYKNLSAMGYLVTNNKGQIYLTKDENGEWIIPKDIDGNDLLSIDKNTGKAIVNKQEFEIADGTNYLNKKEVLQNLLMNGLMNVISDKKIAENEYASSIAGDTKFEMVLDTSDDAAALSKYEMEEARVSREDNRLDMEMDQLETQHNALLKEYDSIKDVINNNIERTFKLFSNS